MRAVAYLRRSSTKQEKSITAQRKAVEKYASDRGYVRCLQLKWGGGVGQKTALILPAG